MKKLNVTAMKNKMEELGMIQANLAESLGVSRESVSQWLKSAKMPRPAYLLKLATLLQMSFSEIILKEEDAIGSFAYRTRRKVKTDEDRVEKATIAVKYLHAIFKDADPSSLVSVPKLENPTNQYAYIQKATVSIRNMMNLDQSQVVKAQYIIEYMRSFPIVFIPVLWGERGDQALVIHLHKLHMF
ncbi:MAG: helix-turn-helix transcriptional regulator, partial [Peptostreptococcaceae bacterium]|nr:helix-turn-helix transcriptional regulator [Peptostreptococcaceae bacterium]